MSQSKNSKSTAATFSSFKYNYEISINTLIVWVFCLEGVQSISVLQRETIKNLYGRDVNFLNPIVQIEHLATILNNLEEMQKERSRTYVIKLCISLRFLKKRGIIDIINKTNAIEICVVCGQEWKQNQIAQVSRLFGFQKHVVFTQNMNQVLQRATNQVQNFTKSSRTFHNSIPLVKQTSKTVNQYRFRLISCINIKASDQEARAKHFETFAMQKFDEIRHSQASESRSYGLSGFSKKVKFVDIFTNYKKVVSQYNKSLDQLNLIAEENERNKAIFEEKYKFWNRIIDIYQQEGFFYQIINNYLRIFKEHKSQWESLAQPISYIYQSIKGLYQHHKKQDSFYSTPFTVYRGGRIKATQVEELMKTAININNSDLIKMEDIIDLLKDFQSGTTQFRGKHQQLYVEFFGFLSTTRNEQKAINTFLHNRRQRDQQTDSSKDYACIFQIKVSNGQYAKQPSNMQHGYYKFTKEQGKGDSQGEVLFNAQNVFKVISVKKMKFDKSNKLVDYDDLQSDAVYYIQLQHGPFEEMVFHRSVDELSEYERSIRLNYCTTYRKMMSAECFDIADAYEATNELQKAQKYYENKLLIKGSVINQQIRDQDRFKLCKKDNKNYMLSVSRVYQKRGLTDKAIQATKLVIKCHQFLQREGDSKIYLSHMKKIEEMQEKIVDIVQKSSSAFERKQFLKLKRRQIARLCRNDTLKSFKMTEVDLAEGVLQFQKGELEESLVYFQRAEKSTTSFFRKIREIKNGVFVKQYLKNLVCCCSEQPLEKQIWKYSTFAKDLKALKLRQIGGQGQLKLQALLFTAIQLYCKVIQSIDERIKSLKSPGEFKSILSRFNQEISLIDLDQDQKDQDEPEISLVQSENTDKIKQTMKAIKAMIVTLKKKRKSLTNEQVSRKKQEIITMIENYRQQKGLFIVDENDQGEEKIFQQFIKHFYKQEREAKLKMVKEKLRRAGKAKNVINEELNELTSEIQQFISNLKEENYSQSNIEIIQSRNQWAKIAFQRADYDLARKQIELILINANNELQVKYQQLAKAHKINGQLQLQMQNYSQAVAELTKSIEYEVQHANKNNPNLNSNKEDVCLPLDKTMFHLSEQFLEQSQNKTDNEEQKPQLAQVQQRQDLILFKTLSFNNSNFLQAQLLRCKACLYMTCELKKTYRNISNNHKKTGEAKQYRKYSQQLKNQLIRVRQEREMLMSQIQKTISQLKTTFQLRKRKFKAGDLEALYQQVLGLYYLNQGHISTAFKNFDRSLEMKDHLYTANNCQSLIMCCQIIYCFSQNKYVYRQLQKHHFMQRIRKYVLTNEDRENYSWKLHKALYFMQKHGKNDLAKKIVHLKAALQNLRQMKQEALQRQIYQLQCELQLCQNPQQAAMDESREAQFQNLKNCVQFPLKKQTQKRVFLQRYEHFAGRQADSRPIYSKAESSMTNSTIAQTLFRKKVNKDQLARNRKILINGEINGYRNAITSLQAARVNMRPNTSLPWTPFSHMVVVRNKRYNLTSNHS